MNKALLLILTGFLTQFIAGQNYVPVIKIYVGDAVSGKNIADAKVTLEGFEINAIEGKYNLSEQFYYFDSIPKGYTTVMAYHKSYNEKGYQNTESLPKELKLKLCNPYRIKVNNDTLNFYKEDKSKIAVVFNNVFDDEKSFGDYLKTNYPELDLLYTMEYNMQNLYCFTKKNKKDFKRFNDPILKKVSEDMNIRTVNGLLLKTKIHIPKYQIYKEYFYENGKPNYIERYIKYVNYDTIERSRYGRGMSKAVQSIAVKSIIENDGEEINTPIPAPVQHPKVNDVELSYREKYKKGLLHNDVYMLHQNELDSLYKIAEERYKKKQFYDYESTSNVKIDNDWSGRGPYMPTDEYHYIPYIAVSNIISLKRTEKSKQNSNSLYNLTINFVTPDQEKKHFFSKYNLEVLKPDEYNPNYYNRSTTFYKTKYIIASPFGLADILEQTGYPEYEVKQEIIQNISDPEANR